MFVDLRPGVRRNVNASAIIAGFFAGAGGIGSGAIIGAATALTALGAVVPGLVAGALFGLGSVRGYRALYRKTVRKAERELAAALDAVQASLKAEVVFGTLADSPPPTPGALPRAATAGISDNS